jgi:hypothetical protein
MEELIVARQQHGPEMLVANAISILVANLKDFHH